MSCIIRQIFTGRRTFCVCITQGVLKYGCHSLIVSVQRYSQPGLFGNPNCYQQPSQFSLWLMFLHSCLLLPSQMLCLTLSILIQSSRNRPLLLRQVIMSLFLRRNASGSVLVLVFAPVLFQLFLSCLQNAHYAVFLAFFLLLARQNLMRLLCNTGKTAHLLFIVWLSRNHIRMAGRVFLHFMFYGVTGGRKRCS